MGKFIDTYYSLLEKKLSSIEKTSDIYEDSQLCPKVTLEDFLLKIELSTLVRLTKDGEHYSGCLADDEFRKIIKKYKDTEVIWATTCMGLKAYNEVEYVPYIEIEIGD